MATAASIAEYLQKSNAALDGDVSSYVATLLEDSADDLGSAGDIQENVGELLESFFPDEATLTAVCAGLYKMLSRPDSSNSSKQQGRKDEATKLAAPIRINDVAAASTGDDIFMRFGDWNANKDVDRSEQIPKDARQTRTRLPDQPADSAENEDKNLAVCQQINKRDVKADAKGTLTTKDVFIDDFDIAYGANSLLHNTSLQLIFQHRYGLCGRNGLGKSTLMKAIARRTLKIPSNLSVLLVEQEVVGDDTTAVESVMEADENLVNLRKEVIVLQNSTAEEDQDRLRQVHQELQEIDADSAPARAAKILSGLGFPVDRQTSPTNSFSGGWRMRLALGRALFAKPDILLLDEPTNMLDLKAIIWLENYLQGWATTLLVVSHDRSFLNSISTDIIYLSNRKLETYTGDYNRFVLTRAERHIQQTREYEAQKEYRAHVQAFIDKFRYNAKRAPMVQSRIKMLEKLPVLEPVVKEEPVKFRFLEPSVAPGTLLKLEELSFRYGPEKPIILANVELSITLKSRICIVGENGAGKTTLLKILTGELEPTKGYRTAHGALRVGYFAQHHVDGMDLSLSPVELLQKMYPSKTMEFYRHALGSFGCTAELALRQTSLLSGGQKSRVAFAIVAASQPHILILDEPTNHLDIETVEALTEAINVFQGAVCLVSHDEQLVTNVCSEVWLCADGSVRELEGRMKEYHDLLLKQLEL